MQNLLFFDIDGTLYDNKNDVIYESTIRALKELHQKGNKLFICSGRPEFMLHQVDPLLHLFDGIVSFNGALIRYHDEVIYKRVITKEEKQELITYFEEEKKEYGYYALDSEGISTDDEYYLNQFREIGFSVPPKIDSIKDVENIVQAYIFSEDMSLIKETKSFKVIKWYEKGADLVLKNESKLHAVKFLEDYFKTNEAHTYVFGDGENDLEMLSGVKNSTCMGNGALVCKSVASYVTDSIDNDGLVKALKHFKLLEEE